MCNPIIAEVYKKSGGAGGDSSDDEPSDHDEL